MTSYGIQSSSLFGLEFTVDSVSYSGVFDTYINIQKRREHVDYVTQALDHDVALSYVQSKDLSSRENMTIRDRSSALAENRVIANQPDQILKNVSGFTIETEKFYVTDIFTPPVGGVGDAIPLFFKHTVSYELLNGESFQSLQLLNTNLNQVNSFEVSYDLSTGTVYSNFLNSYDDITDEKELYFVAYVVKKATGVAERRIELLSSVPVFREATYDDIDPSSGTLIPGTDAYIIQEDITDGYSIIMSQASDLGIRRIDDQRLKLSPPPPSGPSNSWFVSAENGAFISNVQTTVSGVSARKYRIAEFLSQDFDPYYPYKLSSSETPFRVNKRVVKTLRNKVVNDEDELLFVNLICKDENGNGKFALTSNPDLLGTVTEITSLAYSQIQLGDTSAAGIDVDDTSFPVAGSSIDTFSGFIMIPAGFEILATDQVEVTYYYEEDKYEFTFTNFNPLQNAEALDERTVIFCKPEPLGTSFTQTLFYLTVDEDGLVSETNYNEDSVEGLLSDGNDLQDLVASGILYYDRDLTASGFNGPANSVEFIENYTVETSTFSADAFLVLGEVQSREALKPNGLVLNDVRVRGGGIAEADMTTARGLEDEVDWYWDVGMWDGLPYPGAAAFFVDVPVDLLTTCSGGSFTPDSIQELVHRHAALGTYGVVHKYNVYEPTVTGVNISPSGLTLAWTQGPDDVIYDVYLSEKPEGPYDHVATGLNNSLSGNILELTLSALTIAGENRYAMVTGRKGIDGPVCFSGPIKEIDPGSDVPATTISGGA